MRPTWRRLVRRARRPDALGALQRKTASLIDGAWAPTRKRLSRGPRAAHDPDAHPRIALITVNFSTTRFLELMLATLADQSGLDLLGRIVIVDNGSRDGGLVFLRTLAEGVPRVTLVERRRFLSHAHGMRAGVAALKRAERSVPPGSRATHLLFVDTDVIWRDPDALRDLAAAAASHDAALVGELRHGANPRPDVQASLFLVRRDVYDDPGVPPPVNSGSPAYRLQQAIVDRGHTLVDFPTNRGGFALHRGRTGVAAAAGHPRHPYSRATTRAPHYMGVHDGAAVWAATEAAYAHLVGPEGEPALLEHLTARLGTA